ncbi:nucleotidyltransferase [Colwellia sp. MSW7]|uniref:Nucleotidyltransferase n=1 Tax=Colwellia maritima TaxID=2912588 RepID=A0ABS9X0M0_9GAMM|nr:nucleotidyltransferase [Colwellia maritima]MCI2283741.1 nucleotidyltransferase [Colwellia maritima]
MSANLYNQSFAALSSEQRTLFTELLEYACQSLEPSVTKRKLADQRYKSVGTWLAESDDPMFEGVEIYPQGSQRIGTTTKPIFRDEFDLDFICYLPSAVGIHPDVCRKKVIDRLKENGNFKDLVCELNRGCRSDYADEFHLDITPGIPDQNHANEYGAISVPDKKLKEWKASNPKGYAQDFDNKAELEPVYIGISHAILSRVALEAKNIEELPKHTKLKGILKRGVQIMKRHRDLLFYDNAEYDGKAPISIIITTLAALAYEDIVNRQRFSNELEVLLTVVESMTKFIETKVVDGKIEMWVTNPRNVHENFAEKWNVDAKRVEAFHYWHRDFVEKLRELASVTSLPLIKEKLNTLIGERSSSKAIEKHYEVLNETRNSNQLFIKKTGAISTAVTATPVKANTFFGK